jgi:uncharacterized protein (TIGR00645 family)
VPSIENTFEKALFLSRWIQAPAYLGMAVALLGVSVKFFQEIWHLIASGFGLHMSEAQLVLTVLAVIDLSLVGNLIVMVMFSGYENFVSKIDIAEGNEKLAWFGKIDSAAIKQKLAASIVAISSIHLLQVFMNVPNLASDKILWYTVIHMSFVLSAIGLAYVDRLTYKKPQ